MKKTKSFSEYLKDAREYDPGNRAVEKAQSFDEANPGTLNTLFEELLGAEQQDVDLDKFLSLLEQYGLYIQVNTDRLNENLRKFRMELRIYNNFFNPVAVVKLSNIPKV